MLAKLLGLITRACRSLALSHIEPDVFAREMDDGASQDCDSLAMVIEPKTGLEFPTQLACNNVDDQARDGRPTCQVQGVLYDR